MKKMLIYLLLMVFLVNCGGGLIVIIMRMKPIRFKYLFRRQKSNPLATEPLFMVLQKDLTDIN